MPVAVLCLVLLAAHGTGAATRLDPWTAPAADDGLSLQLRGCSVSDSVIAPPRTELVVHYTLIGTDSLLVAVVVDSGGVKLGDLQFFVKQAAPRSYALPFEGILRGSIADRLLDDGFYDIRVRTFSDTGRVEQCILPIEIDRVPPRLLRYAVNGDTARTVTVRNGDTITIDAYLDRPSYAIQADFSRVDNDTSALFTTIRDLGGGHYSIRRFISDANTLPDGTNLPVTLTFTDLGKNVLKDSSLLFCLSNRPPRLLSARIRNDAGPVVRNGSRITLETTWDSSDTLLTLSGDFSGIDSRWSAANVSVSRFAGNRYEMHYTISPDNENDDGTGYIVTFQARDRGCGVSETAALTLELDNSAGSRPVLDPLPLSTRSSLLPVRGLAPGNLKIVLKLNAAVVDTVSPDDDGRFEGTVPLSPGVNTITAEGLDGAGNKTAASLPVSTVYLTEAFVTVPRRFLPGSSIELGLARTGESARIELWNLSGDLLSVLEDAAPRDLYRFDWDGRNSSGETVSAGPVIATIEIRYAGGERETMREAFVLVKR